MPIMFIETICDPLCENPAKVIFLWFAVFYKKTNMLHKVKNIVWYLTFLSLILTE